MSSSSSSSSRFAKNLRHAPSMIMKRNSVFTNGAPRPLTRRVKNKQFMLKLRTHATLAIDRQRAHLVREGKTMKGHCSKCGFSVCGCPLCDCPTCGDDVLVALPIRRRRCNPTGFYQEYDKEQWVSKIATEYKVHDGLVEEEAKRQAQYFFSVIDSLPFHEDHVESDLEDFDFGISGRQDADEESV